MRGKGRNHVQKSCTENNKKANSLPFRELYVPDHVHRKHKNVNIGHSVRKTMDKECDFGIPAGSTGRIPISRYRVALLIHLLTFSSSRVRIFHMYRSRSRGREGEGTYEYDNACKDHPPYSDRRDASPDDSSIGRSGGET
jgi:hypothetical protein